MRRFIFVLIFLIMILGSIHYLQVYNNYLPSLLARLQNFAQGTPEKPKTQKSCVAVNGMWHEEKNICVLPTIDSGKVCNDSKECAGECLAVLAPEEENLLKREPGQHTLYKLGYCSQWRPILGCRPRIEHGQINHITCDN